MSSSIPLTQNEALQKALEMSRKSSSSSSSSSSFIPLPGFAASTGGQGLAMPSGLSTLPGPSGTSTTITLGASPAQAAGLIGPGGLVSLLAAINPTRILVLLNAIGDDELGSITELADACADIGAEAQTICETSGGHLLRIICPRPHTGETIEGYSKALARPEILQQVGAAGLLTDNNNGGNGNSNSTINVTGGNGNGNDELKLSTASFPTSASEFFKQTGGSWSESVAGVVEKHQSAIEGMKSNNNGSLSSSMLLLTSSSSSSSSTSTSSIGSSISKSTWAESVALSTGQQIKTNINILEDGNHQQQRKRTRALGKVFLEFDTITAAIAVQRELAGMFYSGKIVVSSFVDESAFTRGELCDLLAPESFVLQV